AEDGIRDGHVTGVQTCALPISREAPGRVLALFDLGSSVSRRVMVPSRSTSASTRPGASRGPSVPLLPVATGSVRRRCLPRPAGEIGRAPGRDRVGTMELDWDGS